ncbi:hypothetical protein Nepgr_010645 [Nepenthes gracilis]|uniref:Uncharacterized protein n=1 Tax=Nepenthes gracilis TaxID=150966 RepID=A0AAD3XLI6_NEPGR|nr:hypothetical protein Nepgr_010645 [Nepenthes gracilis]
MLYSTIEFVYITTLNPHFVFCVFHVIIAFLLITCSKTTSRIVEDTSVVSLPIDAIDASVASDEEENANDENCSFDQAAMEAEENDRNAEEDELRRRIEAFIEKVNNEWRAEKLRSRNYSFDRHN